MDAHTTCWTMIEGAARGESVARAAFAAQYASLVRRYLCARWGGSRRMQDVGDALQEVFIECYRDGGVLARADRDRGNSFRAFLLGVTRNVARRFEVAALRDQEQVSTDDVSPPVAAEDASLSVLFDRNWARKIMAEAAQQQRANAKSQGAEATRRVELLRLRFHDGLPIRDIAAQWQQQPTHIHRQYSLARTEFRRALFEVLSRYQQGTQRDLAGECEFLLSLL